MPKTAIFCDFPLDKSDWGGMLKSRKSNRAKLPKGSDAKLKGLKLASESTGCKARKQIGRAHV